MCIYLHQAEDNLFVSPCDKKKEIFKDKIITNKRDLIENIINAWHNTPALQEIAKNALPASIAAAHTKCECSKGRIHYLNIEIVL